MDQKRSRETTYECCNYWKSGGPWQKQREMVKSSNDLDWIHFLCWALLSSAMCNDWGNRPIFMILLVKLQMEASEVTRWENWLRDNHCSVLTEQLIVVKQTWCKLKHLRLFKGINFFSLKCNQHCLQTWLTLFVKRHIYFEQHASNKIWWHFPVK